MKIVMFLVGLIVVFVLGFLISSDRKKIKYKPNCTYACHSIGTLHFLLNAKVGFVLVKGIQMGLALFLKLRKQG